jgi:hypothetical protein
MADRYQGRPFPADDDNRGGDQHGSGGSDPLAELARLIGQTDPFGATGRSNPLPPVPRAAPRQETHYEPPRYEEPQYEEAQYEEPQYEEPVEEAPPAGPPAWMQRANARVVPQQRQAPLQEDAPSAVHPLRRHALPAPQYEDYPEEQAYQAPEQHADPARYDEALYGQLESGAQDYQREPAYPDDPYAYQDGYEEEPEERVRKRGGLLTVAAVLALAVVGTGAAFAYRTYVGGPRSGDPPIIKADNTPTKVIPAPTDPSSKTPDRMPLGEGSEKIVPREEKPVEVNANSGAPRVVFPPLTPNGNPPPAASVATAAPPPAAAMPAPTNGTLPSSEPRKIRTLSVRGDQADAGPAPPPAPAATAAKPAKSARNAPQPAASANAPLSLAPDAQASAPAPEPRRVTTLEPPPGAPGTGAAQAIEGRFLVSIASQPTEAEAQAVFRAMQKKYPDQLSSRSPVIKKVENKKGVSYRAMVGPFASREEATRFCSGYSSAGGQCWVP